MMKQVDLVDTTESILKDAGFFISSRCCSRPSCLDFAVKKGKQIVFIKTHANLRSISPKEAADLSVITQNFYAAALFISKRMQDKMMEDDTVYSRYGVYAITPETLENTVVRKTPPLVKAGPGGYYVRLNGKAIREERQNLGLSVGKMAEMTGVSRRTLYGYERELTGASVPTAFKIANILGIPVAKSINVFKTPLCDGISKLAKKAAKNRFLNKVLKKLIQLDFRVARVRKAPFDFIAQNEAHNIIGVITDSAKKSNIVLRTEEIISISKVINAQPIFITRDGHAPSCCTSSISGEELGEISCLEEFIEKLLSRHDILRG